jgi:hypothetical protein
MSTPVSNLTSTSQYDPVAQASQLAGLMEKGTQAGAITALAGMKASSEQSAQQSALGMAKNQAESSKDTTVGVSKMAASSVKSIFQG